MTEDTKKKQSPSKEEMVKELVEQVSTNVEQYHGGSVEMVSFEDDTLTVRLGGACVGCPHSAATIESLVTGTIKQFFPDVEVVEAED